MLNRAARYFPILRLLQPYLDVSCRVLEIGSGARGLTEFSPLSIVGCDISFSEPPHRRIKPVIASATALPFGDQSFDVVIASDVMEHIPVNDREKAIDEALRVTAKVAVFGFPSGPRAQQLDRDLMDEYILRNLDVPDWLLEHMQHPYPTSDLFSALPAGWRIEAFPNESLSFHARLSRRELRRSWRYAFKLALLTAPGIVADRLRQFDTEPCYRQIFLLTR
jgi:hypothetical protein